MHSPRVHSAWRGVASKQDRLMRRAGSPPCRQQFPPSSHPGALRDIAKGEKRSPSAVSLRARFASLVSLSSRILSLLARVRARFLEARGGAALSGRAGSPLVCVST